MTQQQMQQPQLQPPSEAARLFAVEKDVVGLKESVTSLAANVTDGFRQISNEMKAGAKRDWHPVQIGLTIVTIAGGIFFTWVNANTSRIETGIAKVEAAQQRFVPREDLDTRFSVISQRRDDLQRLSDARVERLERDFEGLSRQVVPRGEHEQMWAAQRARDADLQRQADQTRDGLTQLNTPRDTIQGMKRDIDDLRRERRRPGD